MKCKAPNYRSERWSNKEIQQHVDHKRKKKSAARRLFSINQPLGDSEQENNTTARRLRNSIVKATK